ncbi:hypothetical protein GCM10010218_55750 [Streptomyces mashuensis]|uniref:Lipoprotein n=1 Tax=Streptomyces mashuensis TaxID=33904 RepID=A0A919B7D2_9ACTN|nr:hypothetical protein [Streptomyces mashuensis]GHF67123.1 hypothetical protein GCM10010218_55750 [Streptomyces mashuensis]
MKLHHAVRTATASGIAVVALLGAGGCSSDSGTHESAAGSSSAPTAAPAADEGRDAAKDVEVSDCAFADKKDLSATVSATNSSATATYTYAVTVNFTAPDGSPLATQTSSLPFVRPGRTDTLDVKAPATPKAGTPTGAVKCAVAKVVRTTG